MGGEAVADGENVADFAGAGRMVQRAIDTFGRLDTLVNNAGILRDRMLTNMEESGVGRGDRRPPQGRVRPDPSRRRVLARPVEGRQPGQRPHREHVVAVGCVRQRGPDQLRRRQSRHRRVHDHLRARARPLRRVRERDRAGRAHAHDREPRLRRDARRRASTRSTPRTSRRSSCGSDRTTTPTSPVVCSSSTATACRSPKAGAAARPRATTRCAGSRRSSPRSSPTSSRKAQPNSTMLYLSGPLSGEGATQCR